MRTRRWSGKPANEEVDRVDDEDEQDPLPTGPRRLEPPDAHDHGHPIQQDDAPLALAGAHMREESLHEETLYARRHPNDPSHAVTAPTIGGNGGPEDDFGRSRETIRSTKAYLKAMQREERLRNRGRREAARRMQEEAKRLLKESQDRARTDERIRRHQEWVTESALRAGQSESDTITHVPSLPSNIVALSFQEMVPGRAFLRITYDTKQNRHMYEVIEPTLNPAERDALDFLRDTLVRTLPGRHTDAPATDARRVIHEAVKEAILNHSILIDEIGMHRVLYHLMRDFLGYGPIDVLMEDPLLEDISCDGPGIPIFVFHRDHGSIMTNLSFSDATALDGYVIRLAQRSGKHISIADPLLDATLPDGSRLQASLSREVTTRGSSFTIRRFRHVPMTPVDLVLSGTWDSRMAAYFWLLVEHGASLVLAGGTASGKTTTLNAICQYIPPERKIVSIEDTREINLHHDNWIAGVTRSAYGNTDLGHAIDMYRLLEAALRQRPEYLLVGEVRGKEALTLFQAMATGHAVYSTMHADSVTSAVYRLENPPINVPRLMLQTLDVIAIQGLSHEGQRSKRRLLEVTELSGFDPATKGLLTNTVFRWDEEAEQFFYTGRSVMLDDYRKRRRMDKEALNQEWARRRMLIEWLCATGIHGFEDVNKVIAEYYRHPESLMIAVEAWSRTTR